RAMALSAPAPAGVSPAAAALVLLMADPDTPIWLDAPAEAALPWILFHTGAPRVAAPGEAALALGRWDALMPLDAWAQGTPEYPDRSATLIVEVAALTGGPALALSGPGIRDSQAISPLLPAGAAAALAANAARFPLGVDLFLAAGAQVMGLPRSTRVAASAGPG
ncbi:MAG: phosphonate C-P lyase system protein PhnH, partial [Pseudomonadota bacterium]